MPKLPYKVLDAPQLLDDFYLSLVDWSKRDLLAVGLASKVYLWSAPTSAVTLLADLQYRQVTSLSWSRDGDWLAVGMDSGKVQVYSAERLRHVRDFATHVGRVGAMSWSASCLSTGSKDRSILHRDLRDHSDYTARMQSHRHEVCGLQWAPDSQQLASGGGDSRVLLWSPRSGCPVARFEQHTSAVKAIAWSPHQHGLLASGGGTTDKTIRFWDTQTLTPLQCVDTRSQVCGLAWSRHTAELVSTHGYSLNQVMLWKYPEMLKLGELSGHTSRVLYLSMSADGQSVVTGAGDETLRFWRLFPCSDGVAQRSEIAVSFEDLR